MGHAYEAVTSDIISRYHRVMGEDVFFLTGSDEHGQKVATSAAAKSMTPIQSCNGYVKGFKDLNKKLSVSNDAYIRTTDKKHYKLVQDMWKRSVAKGDIILSHYEGWYSVREEKFIPDTEAEANNYEDGCGNKLTKMKEPGYMFKMGNYQERLIKHIEANPSFIQPSSARTHILRRLKTDKLRDLAVSRSKLKWGIPVPDDKAHVMYVWFDALNNYLSGIDYLNPSKGNAGYWPCNVHVIGKDIVWFHCVIWPCILYSCDVPLFKTCFAHGFVNDRLGDKMSKSVGNVVDPLDILKTFSSDQLRYYLGREAVFGADMSFDEAAMHNTCDADLANKLGNLVNRLCNLAHKWCKGGVVPENARGVAIYDVKALAASAAKYLQEFNLKRLCEIAVEAVQKTNNFLTKAEPWKKDKSQAFRVKTLMDAIESVYVAMHFLQPIIPTASKKFFAVFGCKISTIPALNQGGNIPAGTKLAKKAILFPKPGVVGKAQRSKGGALGKVTKRKKGAVVSKKKQNNLKPIEKLVLCVGVIKKVWNMEGSDKLYCEEIDIGEEKPRQIASGLRKHYALKDMQDRRVVVVANLKKKKLAGKFDSHGMVLCGWDAAKTKCQFVEPPAGAKVGERISFPAEVASFKIDPPDTCNANVWKKVKGKLTTNATCVAMFDGAPFTTSAGPCTTKDIANGLLE